jgi:hypothetical protein
MAQGACGPGLLLEAAHTVGVLREFRRQKFERDSAAQIQVLGQVDFAHPARAELGKNPVMRDCLRDHATIASTSIRGSVGSANDDESSEHVRIGLNVILTQAKPFALATAPRPQ